MSPKARNLWIIAMAIALSIMLVGRSPRSAHSTLAPVAPSHSSAPEYVSQQDLPVELSLTEALAQAPAEELPNNESSDENSPAGENVPDETTPTEELPVEEFIEDEPAPEFLDSGSESESPALNISSYQDPQGQFEIGIVEGFTQLSVAGSPLFESTDGAIAYTVVTQELFSEDAEPLPAATLAAIAITTFNQGEGFQNQPSESVVSELPAIVVPWVGTHTTPRGSQPLSGKILVQQRSGTVFLILVAANEDGRDRQDTITNTVFSSFTLL